MLLIALIEFMFSAIRSVLPGLSRWVECCYSTDSVLHFGDHSLLSRCGVQQGDSLGPLCFVLTLHPIAMRIKRELPNLYGIWMMALFVVLPRTLQLP